MSTNQTGAKKAALVVGAGDADKLEPLLAEIRSAGDAAHGFGSDARNEDEVIKLFEQIEVENRGQTTVSVQRLPVRASVGNRGLSPVFPRRRSEHRDARFDGEDGHALGADFPGGAFRHVRLAVRRAVDGQLRKNRLKYKQSDAVNTTGHEQGRFAHRRW